MVLKVAHRNGRLLALRVSLLLGAILVFEVLSQLIALAAVFGYGGQALFLAVFVLLNTAVTISAGVGHRRMTGAPVNSAWVARTTVQELLLIAGLVAIGLGHVDVGWWTAVVYLMWTGVERGIRHNRADALPRGLGRRGRRREWAAAESRLRKATEGIELAEGIMVGSPDDEDIQAMAQQLRLEAAHARMTALEQLRTAQATGQQLLEYNQARLRAALEDFESSRVSRTQRIRRNSDPWDGTIADRWRP
jgi:hypothetical protein